MAIPGPFPLDSSELTDVAASARTALGLGTAATKDASTVGGADKLPQLTSAGSLKLFTGNPTGDALISSDLAGGFAGPAMYLGDNQRFWFLNTAKNSGGSIFYFTAHSSDGGELQINSDHRTALCLGVNGALQIGLSLTDSKQWAYFQQRGGSTVSNTTTSSLPAYFMGSYWNGSASTSLGSSIQGNPDGVTGEMFLDFSTRATIPNGFGVDGSRPLDMRLSRDGTWEVGKAPAFDVLVDGATITQTCSIYKTSQVAKVTLGGNRTLEISGAVDGMRGVIYVRQDSTGSRTLTLPTNSVKNLTLSTTPGSYDRLSWEYDGTNFFWTIDANLTVALDADTTAYIAATGATDSVNLDAFITGLKAMGLWSTSECWPLRSTQNVGSGTTVKSFGGLGSHNGTMTNGPTWGASGIAFDGTDDFIIMSNPAQSSALAAISLFSVFDSNASVNRQVFGSFGSSATDINPTILAGGTPTAGSTAGQLFGSYSLDGTSGNAVNNFIPAGDTGVMQTAALVLDGADTALYSNTSSQAGTTKATYYNNAANWYMGARFAGSYLFLGTQAFHMVTTTALTSAQHTALRDLYKATLGAGLSLP